MAIYSFNESKVAGCSTKDLVEAGCSIKTKAAVNSCEELRATGSNGTNFVDAGGSTKDLRVAGYSCEELKAPITAARN